MSEALRQTGILLGAAARKQDMQGEGTRFLPVVIGIGNLLLCASFEQRLAPDPDPYYLALFLAAEIVLHALGAVRGFTLSTGEILGKTRVFPLALRTRVLLTAANNARRAETMALAGSTVFFTLVLFSHTPIAALLAGVVVLSLLFAVEAVLSMTLLISVRSPGPSLSVFMAAFLLFACGIAGVVASQDASLVSGFLPVRITVGGIMCALRGDLWGVLVSSGTLGAAGAAVFLLAPFLRA